MSRLLAAAEIEPWRWIASSRSALPGPSAMSWPSIRRRRNWPCRLTGRDRDGGSSAQTTRGAARKECASASAVLRHPVAPGALGLVQRAVHLVDQGPDALIGLRH